jgi:isocitrate/isopropylmalate dehydrogenase
VPPDLLPQAAGPDGTTTDAQEQMIVVPAGLFGNLLSGLAGTVGGVVGGLFGSAKTGKDVGDLASPLLKLLPFHTIAPQSAPATS